MIELQQCKCQQELQPQVYIQNNYCQSSVKQQAISNQAIYAKQMSLWVASYSAHRATHQPPGSRARRYANGAESRPVQRSKLQPEGRHRRVGGDMQKSLTVCRQNDVQRPHTFKTASLGMAILGPVANMTQVEVSFPTVTDGKQKTTLGVVCHQLHHSRTLDQQCNHPGSKRGSNKTVQLHGNLRGFTIHSQWYQMFNGLQFKIIIFRLFRCQ